MTGAAQCGLPGNLTASAFTAQATRPLTIPALDVIYPGQRGGSGWIAALYANSPFTPVGPGPGWLPGADVDQPFTVAGTSVGRAEVWVQPSGAGADLQVLLCADSGGSPLMSAPLASAVIPASHITALAATGSLQTAGPLATAASNTAWTGPWTTVPWTPAAATANGAVTNSTPVTSGKWTLFCGGYDPTAVAASGAVSAVSYAGNNVISGPVSMPAIPQPAWYMCASATTDSVIAAGGTNQAGTHFATVWSAPWQQSSGTLGAWTQQQSLPVPVINAGMAAWGTWVFVAGGSPDGTNGNATTDVWTADSASGQITGWTAGPPLPVPVTNPYLAVVGDWLIVAGGISPAGQGTTGTWYAAIGAGGVLGTWQPLDALPVAGGAFSSGWNLAVTDSAVIITSGLSNPGSVTTYTQMLSVGPSGPAQEWQTFQNAPAASPGDYPVAAYPVNAGAGQWAVVAFQPRQYAVAAVSSVPLVSVPLPASGLTAGSTCHLVFRQLGGDTVANFLELGQCGPSSVTAGSWQWAPKWADTGWTRVTGYVAAASVADGTASWGAPVHLTADGGARITTLAYSPSGGQLAGILESAERVAGPLNSNPDFTGGTAPWTVTGGTLTQSTVVVQPGFRDSGLLTPDGTSAQAVAVTEDMACTPGLPVTFAGALYSPPGYTVTTTLVWKDGAGGVLSQVTVTVAVPAAAWTPFTVTAAAPPGAARVAATVTEAGTPATSDLLYMSGMVVSRADPGRMSSVVEVTWAGNQPAAFTRLA